MFGALSAHLQEDTIVYMQPVGTQRELCTDRPPRTLV